MYIFQKKLGIGDYKFEKCMGFLGEKNDNLCFSLKIHVTKKTHQLKNSYIMKKKHHKMKKKKKKQLKKKE